MPSYGLIRNILPLFSGTHVLTTSLVPLLEKAEDPRVVCQILIIISRILLAAVLQVIVTSGGMLVQKLNGADLQF
jgi:hypothetical protein